MTDDRWFRRLLRLLPLDFRADYGDEMARAFREQRREAAEAGRVGVLRVWSRMLADLLAIGPREHATQLSQDVRYALRGMRRQPGFVFVAVITLALGIGANTAVFSVVHAVVLRPLPYAEPDQLVAVWNRWTGRDAAGLSNPEYLDYEEQSRTLTIAASAAGSVTVGGAGGDPERVGAGFVTANAFEVLGVRPVLGRGFRPEDMTGEAAPVAILSHVFWRRRFGGDPAIVGGAVDIAGSQADVIGVMPPGAVLPFEIGTITSAEVLLPLRMDPAAPRNIRGGHFIRAFARLAPGAHLESARAEMDAIVGRLIEQYPDEHDQGEFGIVVRPLQDDLLGAPRDVLLVLAAAVGLVLLLASANVANLMLARGETRRHEMAIRGALGASRFRVVRQLFTEALVLAATGALLGLVVAYGGQRALVSLGGAALPRLDDVALSLPVLVFAVAVSLATGVLFGTLPALQLSRANDALKDGGRGSVAGARSRLRRALVACQVSVAVVLLVAAGLLGKSFARLTSVSPGIQTDGVLTMRIALPPARYPGRTEITSFFNRLLERVDSLPGVREAGAASGLPLAVASGDWSFDIEGRPRIGTRRPGAADWYVVTPGYFEALGIPLRRGRLPRQSDTSDAPPVIFINDTIARTLFPDVDPIGRRIQLAQSTGDEQPWRTIAGVLGDVRYRNLDTPPRPEMFIPHEQFVHFSAGAQARAMSLVLKTAGDPTSLVSAVRSELHVLDPAIPAADVRDMNSVVYASVSDRRMLLMLFGAFAGVALALATIGLYGVMAFSVARRTREMGLRIAVGASHASVRLMVIMEGLRLIAAGAAVGIVAALALGGALTALLYDVRARDASVLAGVTVLLVLTGALAAYVPARRATRVDPVVALRSD